MFASSNNWRSEKYRRTEQTEAELNIRRLAGLSDIALLS